ncbi:MAG: ATP-dependent DNA ligase [Bradyrhizobiaceae bacterium]|nr:MAG: ATP-dependent DNA ligase [Bradyrhizobiaceae bacterium]
MSLVLQPPLAPMEAVSVDEVPQGRSWQYEPKWDGFRCLAFRDGARVELQSKAGQPLGRYFPELVAALRALDAKTFVLDGEIVVPADGAFSFDALLQRVHPAASRIARLAAETPALLIAFDLLADDRGRSLVDRPLAERRQRLEAFARAQLAPGLRVRLSPATTRLAQARRWLAQVGATLDGIVAKQRESPYRTGERAGMVKIKNYRSADCVVGGFRYGTGKNRKLVGSLLLGLYDAAGLLHHVGFTSSIKAAERAALTRKLEALVGPPGFTGNAPGGPSRWSTARSSAWQPLKPRLVVEVCYDHFSGERFRHGTRLLRRRPDKAPKQCTLDQVKQKRANLMRLLDAGLKAS